MAITSTSFYDNYYGAGNWERFGPTVRGFGGGGQTSRRQTPNYSGLLGSMEQSSAAARAANEKRLAEVKGIYDEIIGRYKPGGGFGAGYEAQLGRAKTKDVASGAQSLVSSGLYGTTQTAGLGKKWEEEVFIELPKFRKKHEKQEQKAEDKGSEELLKQLEDI